MIRATVQLGLLMSVASATLCLPLLVLAMAAEERMR